MSEKLENLILREKKKGHVFLRDTFEPHFIKNIEKAIKSGSIDTSKLEVDSYMFVEVVFNILGTNQTPLTKEGEEMKANLEKFIS
jgi:hypothetical protein